MVAGRLWCRDDAVADQRCGRGDATGAVDPPRGPAPDVLDAPSRRRRDQSGARRSAALPVRRAAADDRRGRDRKSTRLNSSHVAISYAVFCLNKKTYTYRKQLVDHLAKLDRTR